MPFKARIDGKLLISIKMSDEEWNKLKGTLRKEKPLELLCCGSLAYPRISKLGTKHFVHRNTKDDCHWKPESVNHLRAKEIIFKACREEGWGVRSPPTQMGPNNRDSGTAIESATEPLSRRRPPSSRPPSRHRRRPSARPWLRRPLATDRSACALSLARTGYPDKRWPKESSPPNAPPGAFPT